MSTFKDTFTKDDAKSSLLEYDDSAFLYFAGTCLVTVLIPWAYVFVKKYVLGTARTRGWFKSKNAMKDCKCSLCAESRLRIDRRRSRRFVQRVFTGRGLCHLIGLLAVTGLLVLTISSLGSMKTIATFDPYEILSVAVDATDKQIRKAYRTMSLKHHPDRNKNDPSAAAKFVLISKAYQTLTDEVAKRNFEKYGNPDGPGMMKVGIGLPKFFVAEQSQLFVLCVFFTILLGLIPMAFIAYHNQITKFTSAGVRVDTIQFMGCYLSEGTRVKQALEMLSATSEAREIPLKPTDPEDIKKLKVKIPASSVLKAPASGNLAIIKNQTLLVAHILRLHDSMSPSLREDLNQLLIVSMPITRCMMELAFINNWFFTVYAIVETRRSLIQALDSRESSLYQVPHFNAENVKAVLQSHRSVKTLADFVKKGNERLKITEQFEDGNKLDIAAFCEVVPDISMTGKCEVEGEDCIMVGDHANINLKLIRNNLKDAELAGHVHSPLFPLRQSDEWWFFASDAQTGKMLSFATTKSREKETEVTISFPVDRRPGSHAAVVVAMCDSYQEIDQVITVPFHVETEDFKKREVWVHPDDAALDDQPTLFQQMMGDVGGDDSDDEDDDEKIENRKEKQGTQQAIEKQAETQPIE